MKEYLQLNDIRFNHTIESITLDHELVSITKKVKIIVDKYDALVISKKSPTTLKGNCDGIVKLITDTYVTLAKRYTYSQHERVMNKGIDQLNELYATLKKIDTSDISIDFHTSVTFKIDNSVAAHWIKDIILKSIEELTLDTHFGNYQFLINVAANPYRELIDDLNREALTDKPFTKSGFLIEFCETVLSYLKNNFILEEHNGVHFSQNQISFCYELLGALGFELKDNFNERMTKATTTETEALSKLLRRSKAGQRRK